jgi:hypothetical protein
MADKTTLKGYFQTGDTPSQVQYADLIDSNLNLNETGTQILVGTLSSSFLEVENHITASGNISASGTIASNGYYADGNRAIIHGTTTGITIGTGGSTARPITIFGTAITASGNISSSGDLIGTLQNKGDGTSTGHITFDSSKGLRFVDSSQAIYGSSNSITVESDDYLLVNADIYASFNTPKLWATGYAQVDGYVSGSSLISETHITASGNISSSGTITGNNLLIDGSQVDFSNLPTSDPGVAGRLFSNNIYVKISQG